MISPRPRQSAPCILLIIGLMSACSEQSPPPPTPVFEEQTAAAGLKRNVSTFSAGVADFDRNGQDDLLIGNHGYPPSLYLQADGKFITGIVPLPDRRRGGDRHGFTLVDLDNDGDIDVVHAAGGADGIGLGSPNGIYRNMLVESGELQFEKANDDSDIAQPSMRSRQFFALASPSGERVDLYLTSLHKKRKGSRNLYIRNDSTSQSIRLKVDQDAYLNRPFESDGKDLMFDFNRDGRTDFLQMGFDHVRLFQNSGERFLVMPTILDGMTLRFKSAVSGDFNNDGYPDLYLGSSNIPETWQVWSDRVSYYDDELHFVLGNQYLRDNETDEISFRTTSSEIQIDFVFHQPQKGKAKKDPSDIYIGSSGTNPEKRRATINEEQAAGQPADMTKVGTYIWHDSTDDSWHVHWRQKSGARSRTKGTIRAENIASLEQSTLEITKEKITRDVLLLNDAGRNWKQVRLPIFEHSNMTADLTVADFNNDGWLDIAGTRTGDQAEYNGTPFILLNHGGMKFSLHRAPENPETKIFRADIIVHGFFNDDLLPDIFYTNGWGLQPTFMGPYQLLLNRTETPFDALVLELQGTVANRDGIGAEVEIYDADEQLLGYRELGANFGRGQDTHKLHFGLGTGKAPYTAKVYWPGNSTPQLEEFSKGGFYEITQEKPRD